MKHIILLLILIILIKLVNAQSGNYFYDVWFSAINIPCQEEDYVLTFEDNFNGTSIDPTKWICRYPYGRNGDQAYYLDQNVVVENGVAKLIAKIEPGFYDVWYWDSQGDFYTVPEHFEYTSGMIHPHLPQVCNLRFARNTPTYRYLLHTNNRWQ